MITYHEVYTFFKYAYYFLIVEDAYFTIYMEPTKCLQRMSRSTRDNFIHNFDDNHSRYAPLLNTLGEMLYILKTV